MGADCRPRRQDEEVYKLLRPYVAEWFRRRYCRFSEPQLKAIPLIKRGANVLVSSPTGTGKTLAVFLGIIDELYRLSEEERLEDEVYAIYISPLRALNNDMRRNLMAPLDGIRSVAREMGFSVADIRVGVRTSDTSPSEKQRMLRRPPHILITTPESLAIALVAPRFRERLATARWVVVDEVHELASSKRGAHLALSLERLEELVREHGGRLQRIGLSATIAPLKEVARFIGGYNDDGTPRPVEIVDARFSKPIDIRVLAPNIDLIHASAEEVNNAIYEILVDLIKRHKTTLVFTNTRSATERVVYRLKKLMEGEGLLDLDEIEAHHSSLSRELRLSVEERLKRGELRVVVSSTSLELGIDIGSIDLVVLLSSPKSVSRLLQRVGRSGHRIDDVSKGRMIVVDRDDLVECSVLAKLAMDRKIDRVRIPRKPLDVLAQHVVGMSVERKWRIDEAYRVVRRAYNFRDLSFEEFMEVVRFLAGKHGLEDEGVYSKIWFDEADGVFGRKKAARMIYQLNAGTIPDEAKIKVRTLDGRYVGSLEEEFVEILAPGDVFVLGGRTYRFLRSKGMTVVVEEAEGAKPTVPSWFSEMLPLSFDSALEVGRFRCWVAEGIRSGRESDVIRILMSDYNLDLHAAESIVSYVREQLEYVGVVPCHDLILVEWFTDDDGDRVIVFHALYGRRVVDALSRAYAYELTRLSGYPVRLTVSDNGFALRLPPEASLSRDTIIKLLEAVGPDNIEEKLRRAIMKTELLKRRFRHVAQRSFMILRRYRGRERSPERMQLSAQRILNAILELEPDNPVLRETLREIMEDYMDVKNARKILQGIRDGSIRVEVKGPLPAPSPFAHGIIVKLYSDVVLMEDKRRILQLLHEKVMQYIGSSRAVSASGQ
ncbi:MAG: ATP-dependent helicase [Desulfurococcales archaeon]|nr:ATP-dependent helicase [Desulfurococcales archaeon]